MEVENLDADVDMFAGGGIDDTPDTGDWEEDPEIEAVRTALRDILGAKYVPRAI